MQYPRPNTNPKPTNLRLTAPLLDPVASARKSLARPFATTSEPLTPRAPKAPKLFSTLAPVIALFTGLIFTNGCADANAAGTPLDDRTQIIEAGVSDDAIDTLLATAELDDAMGVADFHIYNATPAALDLDITSDTCGFAEVAVDSDCGICQCFPGEGIICTDFTCDPAALSFDTDTDAAAQSPLGDDLRQTPLACDNGRLPGESWMEECNVCTCLGDGSITCTLMACEPAPR